MSYQQQNYYPQNPPHFGLHGFGPHGGNFGFHPNQNNYQYNQPFPGRNNGHDFNQPHGGFPPRGNFQPQGFNQQQQPEPAHEHPLNFEERINEKCKICFQNIGENGGYKCKECPIVLCLNCAQKIFFENKNKQIHQHDLLLTDRNSWTCNVCKNSYGDNASFYCQQCDFDACDKCYLNQNIPKPPFPQPQPQSNQQPPFQQQQSYNQPSFRPPYPQPQFQPQPQTQSPYPMPQFQPQPQPQPPYPQPHFQPPPQPQPSYPRPQFPQNKSEQQYPPQQPVYPQQPNENQSQGGYQGENFAPQEQNYYQQGYQEEEEQPESEHEHPLNYEQTINEKCRICLQYIGEKAGYKCKDCPIVLCLNCSDRIFYGDKNKQIHQHELFLVDRNNWNCQICKKYKTENASFHCNQCNFECCDECFLKPQQGYQFQKEENLQQNYQQMHPEQTQNQEQDDYESFHDHPLNYEEKLNDNCKICTKNIGGKEGYKCKDCPIVLCLECLNRIFYGTKNKSLHNHELILKDRANWKCNICKKKNGNAAFYCTQCDFDACCDCFLGKSNQIKYQISEDYHPQTITKEESFHEHPLNYTDNLKGKCELCKNSINNKKGYKCNVCSLVLCLNCSNKIFTNEKNKSVHKDDLLLMSRKAWRCNVCKNHFKNIPSFYCQKCDFDACVDCYIKK